MAEKVWTVALDFDVERKHIVALFSNEEAANEVYLEATKCMDTSELLSFTERGGRRHTVRCSRLLSADIYESNK